LGTLTWNWFLIPYGPQGERHGHTSLAYIVGDPKVTAICCAGGGDNDDDLPALDYRSGFFVDYGSLSTLWFLCQPMMLMEGR
jgi:hypothetical protein